MLLHDINCWVRWDAGFEGCKTAALRCAHSAKWDPLLCGCAAAHSAAIFAVPKGEKGDMHW